MNDTKNSNHLDFIDVIYLAYGKPEYNVYAKIFFDSYKKHNAGFNHNLFIAAKSYEHNPTAYKELTELAKENNAKTIELPDDGMEFAAFYRAAKQCKSKYIFCINSRNIILKNGWLNFFAQAAINNESYKLIGSAGSWENIFPNIFLKIFNKIFKRYPKQNAPELQLIKETVNLRIKASRIKDAIFRPCFFPNFHIRTNNFLIDRQLYIEYIDKYGFPRNKYESCKIESGHNSLTRFILNRGFDIGVIGANSKLYKTHEWDKSETFRNSSSDNLIIGDHHCKHYLNCTKNVKIYLEKQTWGYSATEQQENKCK
ncbi:MAG: hypothetical protein FWG57_03740 [Endomicrobia bacterium]|nr:hypothetical protein [Endomicrobiia bacterium]